MMNCFLTRDSGSKTMTRFFLLQRRRAEASWRSPRRTSNWHDQLEPQIELGKCSSDFNGQILGKASGGSVTARGTPSSRSKKVSTAAVRTMFPKGRMVALVVHPGDHSMWV